MSLKLLRASRALSPVKMASARPARARSRIRLSASSCTTRSLRLGANMQYLDPSATVPDRVRKAFDALTDGLLILDRQGRIVLANRAFRNLHPTADRELNGLLISELRWLRTNGEKSDAAPASWTRALRDANAVTGEALSIAQPDGGQTETIVNCSPIADADRKSVV